MPPKAARFHSLRPGDAAALGLACLLFAASLFAVYGRHNGARLYGAAANIEGEDGKWVYPLDKDAAAAVSGPLGVTTVSVKDGAVSIIESPCKNQTCVMAGAIAGHGQWIACLPNRVLITVENEPDYDPADAGTW
ncbi:MAG: NusG domain II-containing protein [Spirochaetaceae bacterium]|jgi:hypothetical protein|nr:NusG domain II-containing protein [Spirochaetaceae bacterium]